MEELERIIAARLGKMKTAIKEGEALVEDEAQQANQLVESFKVRIAVLDAKLKETEETLQRKDIAGRKMEESLTAEIGNLQSAVRSKEQALASRDSEVNDLKGRIDALTGEISRLESVIEQAKGEAASESQQAGQVIEGLRANIAALEVKLRQTEQISKPTNATVKRIDQRRDRPVIEFHPGLDTQTNGLNESAFPLGRAKTPAGTQAQENNVSRRSAVSAEEKPAVSSLQSARVSPIRAERPSESVPQDGFDVMIAEFSERANVIRSMASLIVRHHVRTLGESMEDFPRRRLSELVESLSGEIPDAKLKANFRERFGKA
jgi:phage shock protein A